MLAHWYCHIFKSLLFWSVATWPGCYWLLNSSVTLCLVLLSPHLFLIFCVFSDLQASSCSSTPCSTTSSAATCPVCYRLSSSSATLSLPATSSSLCWERYPSLHHSSLSAISMSTSRWTEKNVIMDIMDQLEDLPQSGDNLPWFILLTLIQTYCESLFHLSSWWGMLFGVN